MYVNCCCGHPVSDHTREFAGQSIACAVFPCDCVQFCDCHTIVAQMRQEDLAHSAGQCSDAACCSQETV